MTSKSFFRLFGEMEINKLKDFMEHIDLKEIETRVKSTWQFKKMMQKQVLGAAIERNTQDKQNRMAPWIKKVKSKVTTSPEIKLEESRIKVLNVTEVSRNVANII
jgi:hypothetical protein